MKDIPDLPQQIWLQDDDGRSDFRLFHYEGPIGTGVTSNVYRLRSEAGTMIAAKVLKPAYPPKKLRDECENLQKLESLLKAKSVSISVPTGARLARTREHKDPRFLLMEFVKGEDLFKVYRDWDQEAASEKERLDAEVFAWRCARDYLNVVEAFAVGLQRWTGDRKRDTFQWVPDQNRLVIIDWGEFDSISETQAGRDRAEAINSFAGPLFQMFTGRSNTKERPHLLAERSWGQITLWGRLFLESLLARTVWHDTTFEPIQTRLNEFLVLCRDESALRMRFDKVQEEWDGKVARLAPDPATRLQAVSEVLWVTDLARRCRVALPDSEILYKGVRESVLQVTGETLTDGSAALVINRLIEESESTRTKRFVALLRAAREATTKHWQLERRFINELYQVLNDLQNIDLDALTHPDGEKLRSIERHYMLLEQVLQNAGINISEFEEVTHWIKVRREIFQAYAAIRRGDNNHAKERIEALVSRADPSLDEMGFSKDELNAILNALKDKDLVPSHQDETDTWDGDERLRNALTQKDKRKALLDFLIELETTRTDPTNFQQPEYYADFAKAFIAALDFDYEKRVIMPYGDRERYLVHILGQLAQAARTIPSLRQYIYDLPAVRAAVRECNNRKAVFDNQKTEWNGFAFRDLAGALYGLSKAANGTQYDIN